MELDEKNTMGGTPNPSIAVFLKKKKNGSPSENHNVALQIGKK